MVMVQDVSTIGMPDNTSSQRDGRRNPCVYIIVCQHIVWGMGRAVHTAGLVRSLDAFADRAFKCDPIAEECSCILDVSESYE